MLKATQDAYKDHLIIFSPKHYYISQGRKKEFPMKQFHKVLLPKGTSSQEDIK